MGRPYTYRKSTFRGIHQDRRRESRKQIPDSTRCGRGMGRPCCGERPTWPVRLPKIWPFEIWQQLERRQYAIVARWPEGELLKQIPSLQCSWPSSSPKHIHFRACEENHLGSSILRELQHRPLSFIYHCFPPTIRWPRRCLTVVRATPPLPSPCCETTRALGPWASA